MLAVLTLTSLSVADDVKEKTWGEATIMVLTASSSFGAYSNTAYMLSSFYSTNLAAPEGAKGTLTVPETLGIGPVIPLNITKYDEMAQTERLYYWGCSPTVLKGQPEVHGKGWRGKDQWWHVRSSGTADATKMMGLTADSKIPGKYVMETNYTGSMSVVLGEAQQFLPALTVTAPTGDKVDTAQAIPVTWDAVDRAAGYHVMAVGKNADGKDVTWENAYNAILWQRIGATKALQKGLLHAPDKRSCMIPAGIFKGQVSIIVTGVSPIATGTGAFSYWGWAQTMTTKTLNLGG